MKCCKYTAGMLRDKIAIERKAKTTDGQGGYTEVWTADPVGGVWAYVTALSGGEMWQAMRTGSRVKYKAVIRERDDANGAPYYGGEDRVTWQGRTYGIEAVYPDADDRRFHVIMLAEGKPS